MGGWQHSIGTAHSWPGCRYVQEYLAIGEAPHEVRNMYQQRSRWTKVGTLWHLCTAAQCTRADMWAEPESMPAACSIFRSAAGNVLQQCTAPSALLVFSSQPSTKPTR